MLIKYITTIDNDKIYWFGPQPITGRLEKFAQYITSKNKLCSKFKYFFCRCGFGGVVRSNSDNTLNFIKDGKDKKKLCQTCRGKGHPWKCEIWNGKPFYSRPHGDEWKNPVKCKECNGKGVIRKGFFGW